MFCLHASLCEGVGSPGTGVTDSCELPYGDWELTLGPLEKQLVPLTTEPSLQHHLPCIAFLTYPEAILFHSPLLKTRKACACDACQVPEVSHLVYSRDQFLHPLCLLHSVLLSFFFHKQSKWHLCWRSPLPLEAGKMLLGQLDFSMSYDPAEGLQQLGVTIKFCWVAKSHGNSLNCLWCLWDFLSYSQTFWKSTFQALFSSCCPFSLFFSSIHCSHNGLPVTLHTLWTCALPSHLYRIQFLSLPCSVSAFAERSSTWWSHTCPAIALVIDLVIAKRSTQHFVFILLVACEGVAFLSF